MTRIFVLLLAVVGCAHPTGIAPDTWTYASDTGEKCVEQCSAIGMGIATVVLMSGRVGCVCQPLPLPAPHAAAAPQPHLTPVDVLSIMEEEQAEQQLTQPR